MNQLTDDQIDSIWNFMHPSGYGRSRYDIARRLIAADRELQDAEIERLRADADRYRWLRKTTNFVTSKTERIDVRNQPELWDETIDAAIKGATP